MKKDCLKKLKKHSQSWTDYKAKWSICNKTFSGPIDKKNISFKSVFDDRFVNVLYAKHKDTIVTLLDSHIPYVQCLLGETQLMEVKIEELSPKFMIVGGAFREEEIKFDWLETIIPNIQCEMEPIKVPFNGHTISISFSEKKISIKLITSKPMNLQESTKIIRNIQEVLSILFDTPIYT